MTTERIALARYIRDIPDWPKKGILFPDISPLFCSLRDARGNAVTARILPFGK